jgi:hypothetical protein
MIRPPHRAIAFLAGLIAASASATNTSYADDAALHGDHAAVAGEEVLGTVEFRVSCAEPARPAFDRAMGFLHHMMYERGIREHRRH